MLLLLLLLLPPLVVLLPLLLLLTTSTTATSVTSTSRRGVSPCDFQHNQSELYIATSRSLTKQSIQISLRPFTSVQLIMSAADTAIFLIRTSQKILFPKPWSAARPIVVQLWNSNGAKALKANSSILDCGSPI